MKFGSAFLISPSPAYPHGSGSVAQQPQQDVLTPEMLQGLWQVITSSIEEVEGITAENPWLVPSLAEESWWKGLHIGEVTIIIGGAELLRGDILKVARAIEVRFTTFPNLLNAITK